MSLKAFPSTRYQGSKRKILPWIFEHVRDIPFETVLDAFGGTGSVSYLFKSMNKSVTYNDVLKFNQWIGKALIENHRTKLSERDIEMLLRKDHKAAYPTYVQDHFEGSYYLDEENKWIDMVSNNISRMDDADLQEQEYKRAMALFSLFQSCLIKRPFNLFHRKNLALRTRDVERQFSNKLTWDRPFQSHFRHFVGEANSFVFDNGKNCRALSSSALTLQNEDYDLVYLDPPYFRKGSTNETSNYFKCYHFLEGLSNYNAWGSLARFKDNLIAADLTEENNREQLEELFVRFRKSKIVVSYKAYGVPSIQWMCATLKKLDKQVHTASRHYTYALNHQNGDARKNREVLITAL